MILALIAAQALQAPVAVTNPNCAGSLADLQSALERIAAVPVGEVGIAVIDEACNRTVAVNGDRRFPMASTVKLAIAVYYLAEVDAGRRSLATMIAIDDRLRLRADGIAFFAPYAGVSLSAANLIHLMLTRSDNTATDALLAAIGGPGPVEAWIERNRIDGLRIDRPIGQLLLDRRGAVAAPGQTPAEAMRRWDPVAPGSASVADPETDGAANPVFDADPRDTATPLGYARFLARLDRGELIGAGSRAFLLDVLSRTLTGPNRIKGLLPATIRVEHKTGTLSGVTDDVGFVTLPDGRRVVIAAFARGGSERPTVIARAARAVYDRFVPAR